MKRGEIWTLADDGYASKPRPIIVLQDLPDDEFQSIVLCMITSFDSSNMSTRVCIEPSKYNGLKKTSYVMTEKIITVKQQRLGFKIGGLTKAEMKKVSRQVAKVLGITASDLSS